MKKLTSSFVALGILLSFVPTAFSQASEEIVAPQYDFIQGFSDEYIQVKKNGKWGLIDKTGATIKMVRGLSEHCGS